MLATFALLTLLSAPQAVQPRIDMAAVFGGRHWMDVSREELPKLQGSFLALAQVDPEVLLPSVKDYVSKVGTPAETYRRHVDVAVLCYAIIDPILTIDMSDFSGEWNVFDRFPWATEKGERVLFPCARDNRSIVEANASGLLFFEAILKLSRGVRESKLGTVSDRSIRFNPSLYLGGFSKEMPDYATHVKKWGRQIQRENALRVRVIRPSHDGLHCLAN